MQQPNQLNDVIHSIKNSISLKLLVIGIICLILMALSMMIKSLTKEREARRQQVINEVSEKWGTEQLIAGPIISIPYKTVKSNAGNTARKYFHLLPDKLEINGELHPVIRYRGIYKAILYNAELAVTCSFSMPQSAESQFNTDQLDWNNAVITINISDLRGIKEEIIFKEEQQSLMASPGLGPGTILKSGINAGLGLKGPFENKHYEFKININGSKKLSFAPVGKNTSVTLKSDWSDPSFDGSYLPVERRITDKGFSSTWKILDLNRNYPQAWSGDKHNVLESCFGVKLFPGVDVYQKSTRTEKYALLFIVFTFSAIFFSEVLVKLRIHPIQYLLIGFAVTVFYVLLLSIAEHINFNSAYIVSAVAVIALIITYCKSIYKRMRLVLAIGSVLSLLYTFLFVVLQSEDYALLMGSLGLFCVLAAIMFVTRKVNWYSVKMEKSNIEG